MRVAQAVGLGVLVAGAMGLTPPARAAEVGDRILRGVVDLEVPVERVWRAWTTEEGVRSFFAPAARVDLRVDGIYDIVFDPSRPGQTAEGMRILVVEPMRRFVFTWNAPPDQAAVRLQRTVVSIELEPRGERATRLRFTQSGWGEGPEWDAAYRYFDRAWGGFVLPNLKHALRNGPIDWSARPDLPPVAESLAVRLLPAAP